MTKKTILIQGYSIIQRFSFSIFCSYLVLIIIGSLFPRFSIHYQTGEISSGLVPQEGDNFKIANEPAVYRLEDGKRRLYRSDTSFFNHSDNKAFDTAYENGGILICNKTTVLSFPLGDYMPAEPGGIDTKYREQLASERFKKALFRTDKIVHFSSYAIFAILLLIVLQQYSLWSNFIKIAVVFLAGTIIGGGIELLQFAFIPGRDQELLDFIFNSLGLITGVFLYQKISSKLSLIAKNQQPNPK